MGKFFWVTNVLPRAFSQARGFNRCNRRTFHLVKSKFCCDQGFELTLHAGCGSVSTGALAQ